jgi:N-acetylglutamate synthase-like GNAT family acetyltransferase
LQWRASVSNPGDRDALLAHPDAIALPIEQITHGDVIVAERNGITVGFATGLPRPDGQAVLDALCVEPDLWRGGIGRVLVEHCVAVARERSSAILHVVGNPHAEGFYVACGFRTSGSVDTRFGRGLAMQREL